jgi:hypothetical protein
MVTLSVRSTVPLAGAVNVISFVPWPVVIVPPAIVQTYVAPACARVLAVLSIELEARVDGALMVEMGFDAFETSFDAVTEQPEAFVAVTM